MCTLFMDRDGVVNEQIIGGYVQSFDQFVYKENFFEAMKLLRSRFRHIILVTNQQGIGKGICTQAQVDAIHQRLQRDLLFHDCAFDAIYCCPHLASEQCDCRKPNIGMALQACHDFPDIDLLSSFMVGDSLSDMQFGQNAGMTCIHVGATDKSDYDEILQIASEHYDSLYEYALKM